MDISYFAQDLLDALSHIHICNVSPQVSSGYTWQYERGIQ